jgi:hypothetical protein
VSLRCLIQKKIAIAVAMGLGIRLPRAFIHDQDILDRFPIVIPYLSIQNQRLTATKEYNKGKDEDDSHSH